MKRGQEGLQRPSVVSEEDSPRLEIGHSTFHGSSQRTDLIIVIMLTNIQVAVFRLAYRRGDVISPDEPLVADDSSGSFKDRFTCVHSRGASREWVSADGGQWW